jgi:hypothetical protein
VVVWNWSVEAESRRGEGGTTAAKRAEEERRQNLKGIVGEAVEP